MEPLEETGKTVEEATQKALEKLEIEPEEAKIEILEKPSKGLFGLGSRLARVKVVPQKDADSLEAARIAKDILNLMGFSDEMKVSEEQGRIHLDIKGDGSGLLIGRRGATLSALQFLVGLILSRKRGRKSKVVVDTEGYRSRRSHALAILAQRTANQVKLEGKEIGLGPMNPYDRHVVHSALQHHRDVRTISDGERGERQVIIIPKKERGA